MSGDVNAAAETIRRMVTKERGRHYFTSPELDAALALVAEVEQLRAGWQQKENEAVEAMNRADEIRAQALSEGRRADDMEKERDEARAWWTRESYTVDRLKAREQRLQEALERISRQSYRDRAVPDPAFIARAALADPVDDDRNDPEIGRPSYQ